MLIRTSFSPLLRATTTLPGKRYSTVLFSQPQQLKYPSTVRFSLGRPQIMAALLTTQTNNSAFPTHHHSAASSLRGGVGGVSTLLMLGRNNKYSQKNNHAINPLLATTLTTQQLAYFSSPSRGGGGAPKGGGGRYGWAGGMLGTGALLAGKGKYLLGALKLTKLSSLASMFVTVGAYSMVFGPPYAIGMVGLILVHECKLLYRRLSSPLSRMMYDYDCYSKLQKLTLKDAHFFQNIHTHSWTRTSHEALQHSLFTYGICTLHGSCYCDER